MKKKAKRLSAFRRRQKRKRLKLKPIDWQPIVKQILSVPEARSFLGDALIETGRFLKETVPQKDEEASSSHDPIPAGNTESFFVCKRCGFVDDGTGAFRVRLADVGIIQERHAIVRTAKASVGFVFWSSPLEPDTPRRCVSLLSK